MTDDKLFTWNVEATIPDTFIHPMTGKERATTVNRNLQVVASTLEEAVAAVKLHHRDVTVTFIKVMRDRWVHDLIVAGEVIK